MNSHVERAVRSKKIQRGLVAFVVLLLAAALFVGAGAAEEATENTLVAVSQSGADPTITITGSPLVFAAKDTVEVKIEVVGSAASSKNPTPFTIQVNNADPDRSLTQSLVGTTVTWTYQGCTMPDEPEVTLINLDVNSEKIYEREGNTLTIISDPTDVLGGVIVEGTLVPTAGQIPTATLTITGKVTEAEDYSKLTMPEVKDMVKEMVPAQVIQDGKASLTGYTITATLIRTPAEPVPEDSDKKDDGYTGNGNAGPGTVIPPAPTTQTVSVSADGTASASLGGTTYTIDLGAGAAGNVIVTELGSNVQLPAGATVLTGADITLTVPLANGKTASVAMSLSKSKLPAGASVADVVMQHFENGQWVDLPTVYTEYGSTVKYAGTTDSFSPFILVHKVNGATPAETVPTTAPTASIPTETPASPGFGIFAALAGLGAVAVLRRN